MTLTQTDLHDLLTREHVAEYTGISVPTLDRWAGEGLGPKRIKLGRAVRYRKTDLLEWIDARAASV